MTSITSALPNFTPPPVSQAPAAAIQPTSSVPDVTPATVNDNTQSNSPTAPITTATPNNANTNAPAIYTALASESTSTIRGTSVNTLA